MERKKLRTQNKTGVEQRSEVFEKNKREENRHKY